MGVFDVATPAGSDPLSQGDDRIREFKVAIQEALRAGAAEGDEAVFPGASPLSAPIFRYRGLKGNTAARPAAAAGGLYLNTETQTFQRSNGTTWDDVYVNPATGAIHAADSISLASALGVVTLTEAGNAFHVSGTEAVTQIAGWTHGVAIVRWTQGRTLTHNGSSLILLGGANRVVAAGDVSVFQFVGSNQVREIGLLSLYSHQTLPTRQTILSGSGTYNTPTGCRQLRVRMIGGGGGGGGSDTSAAGDGGNGVDTTFSTFTGGGGGGGGKADGTTLGGAGGTASLGGGSGSTFVGGSGGGGFAGSASAAQAGGNGGNGIFGGGGGGGYGKSATGTELIGIAGATNTGGGGGGAGGSALAGARSGSGGGAGGAVDGIISGPAATYSYAVGAGGAAGAGNGNGKAGGAGAAGRIIVEEIY